MIWALFCTALQVESYWDECLALPSKLKDWDAYNEMKGSIQQYRDVFPLLHKLASRVSNHLFYAWSHLNIKGFIKLFWRIALCSPRHYNGKSCIWKCFETNWLYGCIWCRINLCLWHVCINMTDQYDNTSVSFPEEGLVWDWTS